MDVRRIITVGLPVLASGVLVGVLLGRRDTFLGALDAAPLWLLACAVALQLQLLALLARGEAWRLCVGAAGSTISRRGVFRASGIGGLAGILNGVAVAAAAGVLLSATGMAGTLCFGGWALADRLRPARALSPSS